MLPPLNQQLRQPPGTWLGDRAFGSYQNIALLFV
jgi:hypothetical protein